MPIKQRRAKNRWTVNRLRTEINRERWDQPQIQKGTQVVVRDWDGVEYSLAGVVRDGDKMVLLINAVLEQES